MVRVRPGVQNRTHSESQNTGVAQFLAGLRFEQRHKLAELPEELAGGGLK